MHDDLKAAVELLQKGGLVLFPTDTGWGIGCDANNPEAISRLLKCKKPGTDEPVVLMENAALLDRYVKEVPEIAFDLIDVTDKPLTLVFEGARNLANTLLENFQELGFRITSEEFSSALIRRFKRPLVFIPAHSNSKPAKVNSDELLGEYRGQVDYSVQYQAHFSLKSVVPGIIKLGSSGEIKLIR